MERWKFDRSDVAVGQGRRSVRIKADICRESMIILVHAVVGCVLFARSIKRRLYRRNCLDVIPWSITKTRPGTSEEGFTPTAPLKFSHCRVPGNVNALLSFVEKSDQVKLRITFLKIDQSTDASWKDEREASTRRIFVRRTCFLRKFWRTFEDVGLVPLRFELPRLRCNWSRKHRLKTDLSVKLLSRRWVDKSWWETEAQRLRKILAKWPLAGSWLIRLLEGFGQVSSG